MAAEKKNYPNLLVSCAVFFVALRGEYETLSGAIMDNSFFPRP